MSINNKRIPIEVLPGESLGEFKYFLYYASMPPLERSIKKAFESYIQEYPTEKPALNRWRTVANQHNWDSRAKELDSWLLLKSTKELDTRAKLVHDLLTFKDGFQRALLTNMRWRRLLNALGLGLSRKFEAEGTTEEFTVKAANLHKISTSFVNINHGLKSDYEIWGALLGLQDIIERQNAALCRDLGVNLRKLEEMNRLPESILLNKPEEKN